MKGRQDRNGIHEVGDTHDPITQSLYCCLVCYSYRECGVIIRDKSKHSFTVVLLFLVTFLLLYFHIPFNKTALGPYNGVG